MSTTDDYCSKKKCQTSDKKNGIFDDRNNQFKNINLNQQNYNCVGNVDAFLKFGSKSSNNGRKDYPFNLCKVKNLVDSKDSVRSSGKDGFYSSWKKNDISKAFETLNFSSKTEEKNRWKTTETSESKNKTSSTLSLHTYENFVEASESDKNQLKELKSCKTSWKNCKSVLASTDSVPAIQDSFEFPRQNEDGSMEPEVMQFQASQVLLDPNVPRPNAHQRKINALIDAVEEVAKLYEKNQIAMEELIERLDAQHQRLGYDEGRVYRTWSNYVLQVQKRFDEARGTFESATDERMAQIQRIFEPTFCINPGPSSSLARPRQLGFPTLRRLLSTAVPEHRIEFLAEGEIRQMSFVREESIDTTRPGMDGIDPSTFNDFGEPPFAMNQPQSSSEQNESINATDPINADEMVVEEEEQQEIAAQSNQGRKRRRKGAAGLLTVKRTKKSTSNAARSISMNPSLSNIQSIQRGRTAAANSVPPQNLQNINASDARNHVVNSNGLSPANGHQQQQQPQPTMK